MILPILAVKDVDASVTFYTEKFGFTHSFSIPGSDGRNSFAFVTLGDAITMGLSLDPALEQRGRGIDLMLYPPDSVNLDQLYDAARSKGVTMVEEIGDRYWGDRTFSLDDPDGYRITFARTVRQVPMDEIEALIRSRGTQ
jgi:PhnB protein